MLVLSRRVDERIVIDGNIRITVVSIRGNQVRLGIEAPSWINIYRQELADKHHGGEDATRMELEVEASSPTAR